MFCKWLTGIAVFFYTAVVSIAEVATVIQFNDAQSDCAPSVWYSVLACSIVRFMSGCLIVYIHRTYTGNLEITDITKLRIKMAVCCCLNLASSCYVAVTAYKIPYDCDDIYKKRYPALWVMYCFEILVSNVYSFIIVILVLVLLISCCCTLITKKCYYNRSDPMATKLLPKTVPATEYSQITVSVQH